MFSSFQNDHFERNADPNFTENNDLISYLELNKISKNSSVTEFMV